VEEQRRTGAQRLIPERGAFLLSPHPLSVLQISVRDQPAAETIEISPKFAKKAEAGDADPFAGFIWAPAGIRSTLNVNIPHIRPGAMGANVAAQTTINGGES
jgi:hypothetical protein